MQPQQITILAKAHNGKVAVNTEIPVPDNTEDYVVTINIAPQTLTSTQMLDQLYGILADDPMPEIDEDPFPEERDNLSVQA